MITIYNSSAKTSYHCNWNTINKSKKVDLIKYVSSTKIPVYVFKHEVLGNDVK